MNSNELAHELAPVNSNELTPAAADSWYEWTLANYLPAHPELLQTDANGRGIGVKALGEAMAEACGKDYASMKGMASGVAKRLRSEV